MPKTATRKTQTSESMGALPQGENNQLVKPRPGKRFTTGNPGGPGRSKGLARLSQEEAQELAKTMARQALNTLKRAMGASSPPSVQIAAAGQVLDRAYGKAAQVQQVAGEVRHVVEVQYVDKMGLPAPSASVIIDADLVSQAQAITNNTDADTPSDTPSDPSGDDD